MAKRTLSQLDVAGKRVLVRVDFNIPIEQGVEAIASYDQRLRATIPTIQYLIDQRCKVILCSHLGRPNGQVVEELRLGAVGERLATLLETPVQCLGDMTGPRVRETIGKMKAGNVALLENLRFHPGEESNNPDFAKSLAELAECFVMDAFAVAHRSHASTVGLPGYLPSAMGLLVQKEVESMGQALESPEKPLAALLGGAKVSDKILILENILETLDYLLIGGGMSVTFLKALGFGVGASRYEEDRLDFARDILVRAQSLNVNVQLPSDLVVSNAFDACPTEVQIVPHDDVPDGWYIMDIASTSTLQFTRALRECKTIIWNGPLGVFEMARFSEGTRAVANSIANLEGVTTIVGGGSTAEAVEAMNLTDSMTHVSTGGGASLEFMEGKELPGIAALPDA